tara:strand:- start:2471 stop:2764 length:294 start_codon:yes stop_codon:yes gene_type:complete
MEKINNLELGKLEDIRQQLREVKNAIATAHEISNSGTRVKLVALQNSVQCVCNEINRLPQFINSDDLESLIKGVIEDFDALSRTLTDQHKIVAAKGE